MTETLPTYKEADFNDVLAGFELFGFCTKDAPDDLEGLEHYCEALAFVVSRDLMAIQKEFHGRCFGMGANDDFMEAESWATRSSIPQHASWHWLRLAYKQRITSNN